MGKQEIRWAPRVPQALIQHLYENDAQGFTDSELVDEVGWRLLARCQSFIQAVEAVSGRVNCPVCTQLIIHSGASEEVMHCPACGWEKTWGEYFATI